MPLIKQILLSAGITLAWGIQWAIAGLLIGIVSAELPSPTLKSMLDPWIALALPGFFGGILFSIGYRISGKSLNLRELTVPQAAGRGAAVGVALGTLPFLFATPRGQIPLATIIIAIYSTTVILSIVSAIGVCFVWRWMDKRPSKAISA